MEAKEEIRARLNIEDVIGQYIQLSRAGRNFKGLSPVSNEKTPSFMVSPEKHIWHDFSSNKGGDVFSFIMEVEGLDFRGALELLARKAGVDLAQFQRAGDRGASKKKERLYQALDLATRFYQQHLIRTQTALEYVFKTRGFSKEVAQTFHLGYAPNSDDALVRALSKRGFTERELRDAGLATQRRAGLGDMFRGRMMVPLADAQGRIVGFTARLITDQQPNAPKYINTPQTLLYDKGRQVFGLHLAKEAIRRQGYAVLVEGNLDVIASHQAGTAQVVATAGTAMTEYHVRSLSRLTHDLRLCFDTDAAGVAATERAIGIASKLGVQLSVIQLPEGAKDPDELIHRDATGWRTACESPRDALEWLLDLYCTRFDPETAEGKRQITTKLLAIISELGDPVTEEHYMQLLSARIGVSLRAIQTKLRAVRDPAAAKPLKPVRAEAQSQAPNNTLYQDHLLALSWVYPALRDSLHRLEASDFSGRVRQALFVLMQKLGERVISSEQLQALQSDELCVKIKEIELIAEQKYPEQDDSLYFVASELSKRALIMRKTKQKDILAREIDRLSDDTERHAQNLAYKALVREIEDLKH